MAELMEAQRKCAALQTRNVMVEEELQQYKDWMKVQMDDASDKFKQQLALAQAGR